jgi:hypothetical protein
VNGPAQIHPRLYAFLADGGSAARLMDRVAMTIASDVQAQALLSRPRAKVLSDIKVRVKSGGSPAIKSLYWSVQAPDRAAWGGLSARTLIVGPQGGRWLDLPADPALGALEGLQRQPVIWEVLRYIPMRRATLLHRPDAEHADKPAHIVKVKRPERAADAARRLAAVNEALGVAPPVIIPRLLQVSADGTLRMSLCQGASLGSIPGRRVSGLLWRIGQMHARLHACPCDGLPFGPTVSDEKALAFIGALSPNLRGLADRLSRNLGARPLPSAPVLCHGDAGLDQILLDGERLSLVDFDLSHAGEAAADIAQFLVVLAENGFGEDDRARYLDGYADVRRRPEPARLQWFLAKAVTARVLVYLRKDQAHRIPRVLGLIDEGITA